MMVPIERPAILNTIARGAIGQNIVPLGISIYKLIDEEALRKSFQRAWEKLYNFFNTVGTFSVIIFGIWVTFKTGKFILDIIVHGIALHSVYS